jgi:hypothetical protein
VTSGSSSTRLSAASLIAGGPDDGATERSGDGEFAVAGDGIDETGRHRDVIGKCAVDHVQIVD